jgi:hypothetical protein
MGERNPKRRRDRRVVVSSCMPQANAVGSCSALRNQLGSLHSERTVGCPEEHEDAKTTKIFKLHL